MTVTGLLSAFSSWSAECRPLVLASVYETEGSTYSKAGARMLITGDGKFHGMLSGGCLEGDLAERARAVIESGQAQAVTYDLGQNDEELWGLGVGCATVVAPTYSAEISPAKYRGRLVAMFQFNIVLGIFISIVSNWFINQNADVIFGADTEKWRWGTVRLFHGSPGSPGFP